MNEENQKQENIEAEEESRVEGLDPERAGAAEPGYDPGEDEKEEKSESGEIERLKAEIARLDAEKKDLVNLMQRVQADFENFRRRTRTEKEELVQYAAEGLITRLLPVVDNFERALASVRENEEMKSFLGGVEMIFRQFYQVLTGEGLSEVESVGCPFDPNCHEAVMQEDGADGEKDLVTEELQKGYRLKGKLIRPSMVKVTK